MRFLQLGNIINYIPDDQNKEDQKAERHNIDEDIFRKLEAHGDFPRLLDG